MSDCLTPFKLEKTPVRGRLVQVSAAAQSILNRHQYPPVIEQLLSEALALGALIAHGYKYEGVFTLQIMGDGPVSFLVVDITSEGHLRGCVRYKAELLEKLDTPTPTIQNLFGGGYLAFTIDQPHQENRYQGTVALQGATLLECLHHYFRQSEQLETALIVFTDQGGAVERPTGAAALMIQRMPLGEDEITEDLDDQWIEAVSKVATVKAEELLGPGADPQKLLHNLFWETGVTASAPRPFKDQCRCSRERIQEVLDTFEPEDRDAMVVEDKIIVTCEFCSASYEFAPL